MSSPDIDQLLIDMGAASYALSILYELRQAINRAKITGDVSEVHRVLAEHRVRSTTEPAGPTHSEGLEVTSEASARLLSRGDSEAQDWATEFLAINAVHGIASDWEALVTWFSNAIEVGRTYGPQYRAFGGPRKPRLHITNDDADRLETSTLASRSVIHLLEAGGPRTLCCAVPVRELPRDAVLTYAEERTTCRCTVAGCHLFADQHADWDHHFTNAQT